MMEDLVELTATWDHQIWLPSIRSFLTMESALQTRDQQGKQLQMSNVDDPRGHRVGGQKRLSSESGAKAGIMGGPCAGHSAAE